VPDVLAMLPVHNEADRYLTKVLTQLSQLCDSIVVYDDASTDQTSAVCAAFPKVQYFRGDVAWFGRDESQLRHHLWLLATAYRPDWILALDADELFEERVYDEWPGLFVQDEYEAVAFRLFDFWKSTTHVRVDGAWNPWRRFSPLLVRYRPELPDAFLNQPLHCGRFPVAYQSLITFQSHLRVRHYGWADSADHLRKYLFYRERDLAMRGRVDPHTESVLSPLVTLEPWLELPSPPFFGERPVNVEV
jgi:glycosyltransferase involved in cell wall biosynthesis